MHCQTFFFHTNANDCVCYQNILMFFFTLFYLNFLTWIFFHLIINNEYKSMVFTILEWLKHSRMQMHVWYIWFILRVNHAKEGHGLFVHVAYCYYMSELLFTLEFRKEIRVAEWGYRYIHSLWLELYFWLLHIGNTIGKTYPYYSLSVLMNIVHFYCLIS